MPKKIIFLLVFLLLAVGGWFFYTNVYKKNLELTQETTAAETIPPVIPDYGTSVEEEDAVIALTREEITEKATSLPTSERVNLLEVDTKEVFGDVYQATDEQYYYLMARLQLPPATVGYYYAGWLLYPGDKLVSAGTFMENDTGEWICVFARDPPERFTGIGFVVTEESIHGDPKDPEVELLRGLFVSTEESTETTE
jgi:hypothetical protein